MKTIFNANKKSISKPEFVSVRFMEKYPDYWIHHSREMRNKLIREQGGVYAITVYPKKWPN